MNPNRDGPQTLIRGRCHRFGIALVNPKGIPALSPGLRVRELPWKRCGKSGPTLKGLKRRSGVRTTDPAREHAATLSGLNKLWNPAPRVASRTRQPGAEGLNPFGIDNPRVVAGARCQQQARVRQRSTGNCHPTKFGDETHCANQAIANRLPPHSAWTTR
jgi:hypothetical protein